MSGIPQTQVGTNYIEARDLFTVARDIGANVYGTWTGYTPALIQQLDETLRNLGIDLGRSVNDSQPRNTVNAFLASFEALAQYQTGSPTSGQPLTLSQFTKGVQLARADLLQIQLQDQMDKVEQQNIAIDNLAALRGALESIKPTESTPGGTPDSVTILGLQSLGISLPQAPLTWATYNTALDAIKAKSDKLSQTQQLDMVRVQSLMNKLGQAYEFASNLMQKFQKMNERIIDSLR